jgi:hypothetical protein
VAKAWNALMLTSMHETALAHTGRCPKNWVPAPCLTARIL